MNKTLSSKEKICDTIMTVLKKYQSNKVISIDQNQPFDKLGLDSLNILLFISDLEDIFSDQGKIDIDLPTLMHYSTPKLLAQYIHKNLN
jgi:acyl carrier protein